MHTFQHKFKNLQRFFNILYFLLAIIKEKKP